MRIDLPKYHVAVTISLSILFLLFGITSSWLTARDTQRQGNWVTHTVLVIVKSEALLRSSIDAEIGMRRYLTTERRKEYLDFYLNSRAATLTGLDQLAALTYDNNKQAANIERLGQSLAEKLSELRSLETASKHTDSHEVTKLLDQDLGKVTMDSIRAQVFAIEALERELLLQRQKNFSYAMQIQSRNALLSILVGFLLILLSAYVIDRQRYALLRSQSELLKFNTGLEQAVAARTAELLAAAVELDQQRGAAEFERARVELLLRELNHRVGNNLAMVSAFLGLEAAHTKSEEVRAIVERARVRIQTIATAQRRLRFDDRLEMADTRKTLADVLKDLVNTAAVDTEVNLETNIAELMLTTRDITTLAIIVSELVTNAFKYAYIGCHDNRITVTLSQHDSGIVLKVVDNGTGFNVESIMGENKSLGQSIIARLARQYGGRAEWQSRSACGTSVTVTLPKMTASLPATC